ncbi:MAG: VWA domain-containing protein [Pseudomonadota bacterium]
MIPSAFHFLRPEWLLALLPLAILVFAAWRRGQGQSTWQTLVDRHLLKHLLMQEDGKRRRWPLGLLALGWLAAVLALAGPAWERLPQPAHTVMAPTVVALNLSQSMNATDESPSRLTRAKHKIYDLIDRQKGGQIGLVLFTDTAFTAVPLTDDGAVISELLPLVDTSLMPDLGARVDLAIEQSTALLSQSGAPSGQILLLSDGMTGGQAAAERAAGQATDSGYSLGIITLGKPEGGAVMDHKGRPVLDSQGGSLYSVPNIAAFHQLAEAADGQISAITPDDGDLNQVLATPQEDLLAPTERDGAMEADSWRDMGLWLVLIPVALAPLAFRRGWLAVVVLSAGMGLGQTGKPAYASSATLPPLDSWTDLWQTKDQQGARALSEKNPTAAAHLFENPDWKAAALYKSQDYDQAAAQYEKLGGKRNLYNLGNARAKSGDLEGAIAAYDELLAQQPDHDDARFNRDLVQSLLDQQAKQEESKSNESSQDTANQSPEQQQQEQAQGDQAQGDQAQGDQTQDQHSTNAQEDNQTNNGADPNAQAQKEKDQSQDQSQQQSSASGADSTAEQTQSSQSTGNHAPKDNQQDEPSSGVSEEETSGKGSQPDEREPSAIQEAQDLLKDSLDSLLDPLLAEPQEDKGAENTAESENHAMAAPEQKPMSENQQAREQTLRLIPDDPAGLLRARIHRHYAQMPPADGLPNQ